MISREIEHGYRSGLWNVGAFAMTPENTDLVGALLALKRQIPGVCLAMTQSELHAETQAEFGELLIQLGHLIKQHTPPEVVEGQTGQPITDVPGSLGGSQRQLEPSTSDQKLLGP